jgi:hypothetical protein
MGCDERRENSKKEATVEVLEHNHGRPVTVIEAL